MEFQKITILLGSLPNKVPRFINKKWIEVYDQSGTAEDKYKTSKQIRFKTLIITSDLCDYNDAYIVVKGKIVVTNPENDAYHIKISF